MKDKECHYNYPCERLIDFTNVVRNKELHYKGRLDQITMEISMIMEELGKIKWMIEKQGGAK